MRGRVSPIKVHASDVLALLFGPWTILQTSSFLPLVSYAGESFTYQGLRIRFHDFCYLDLGLLYRSHPSCLHQHLMRERFSPIKIHASDSSALLFRPRSTLQSSSFSPLVSYAGESIYLSPLEHSIFWTQCGGEPLKACIWSNSYHHVEIIHTFHHK